MNKDQKFAFIFSQIGGWKFRVVHTKFEKNVGDKMNVEGVWYAVFCYGTKSQCLSFRNEVLELHNDFVKKNRAYPNSDQMAEFVKSVSSK